MRAKVRRLNGAAVWPSALPTTPGLLVKSQRYYRVSGGLFWIGKPEASQSKKSPHGPRLGAMVRWFVETKFCLLARAEWVSRWDTFSCNGLTGLCSDLPKGRCPFGNPTKEPVVPWILPSAAALNTRTLAPHKGPKSSVRFYFTRTVCFRRPLLCLASSHSPAGPCSPEWRRAALPRPARSSAPSPVAARPATPSPAYW